MPKIKHKEEKMLTIAQQAGYARRKLKNRGIDSLADHRGKEVPVEYVPDMDLLKHFECLEIINEAKRLERELSEFKYRCQQAGDELYDQLMRENEIRDSSIGGFTVATFDKKLKVIYKIDTVQVKIPEELEVAKHHWETFLDEYYGKDSEKDELLIEMVNELLHNTKGQIDLRNIARLNRMGTKVKHKSYQRFLKHLNQAYDTRHTKRYEQFYEQNKQGDYDSIVISYAKKSPQAPENE